MSGHLLITGFGPFPGMPRNPAEALARHIRAHPRLRLGSAVPPRVLVMRTAYRSLDADLAPALAERPAAVLMLGVASRARRLRVEARARNRGSQLHPDASGRPAARLALDRHGPPARVSPHAARALATLRRHGLAVRPSVDAGHYLCNASYFLALAQACPVLFVHVPPVARTRRPRRSGRSPSRVEPARQTAALVEVALALAATARAAEFRR